MVEVSDLEFSFTPGEPLLQELSLAFARQEISVILGRNGAGKTTLLRCLHGLLKPQRGTITLDGIDIRRLSCKQIARYVAVVRQDSHHVFPYNVLEVVLMGRTPHLNFLSATSANDVGIARECLAMVGMSDFVDRPISALSSGELQLVLLARALCQTPKILLLDEPNAHLDIYNQWRLLQLISRLRQTRELTVIAVIHLPEIAYWFADRVFMLEKGRLLFSGPPDQVMTAKNLSHIYQLPMTTMRLSKNYLAVIPENLLRQRGQAKE